MNKKEFVNAVAHNGGLTQKDAEWAVELIFETLAEQLTQGETVQIKGFGAFSVRDRSPRDVRNPKTNQMCHSPAAKRTVFAAGEPLRRRINDNLCPGWDEFDKE